MKYEINLFEKYFDYRWDRDRNADLLNIVFHAGTFGHFLKYFLEKFSLKTSDIAGNPFTEIGTSHNLDGSKFSGLIQKYHPSFINDNKGQTNLPVCIILPTTEKHFLYLKKAQLFRMGDEKIRPDFLWQKAIGEMPGKLKGYVDEILKLYNIKETAHYSWIPKFIVRDWYKLEFLQELKDTYNHHWFNTFKTHKFFQDQKLFQLDLETFFDWDTFIENITELDDMFGLSLDYDRKKEMKEIFDKGYSLDGIRQECNLAIDVLKNETDNKLNNLDVATEGFIYAQIEKANDFIQTPLVNRFFRDADEIRQFVEHYPNHYKAMNPNMPTFNGIPNPYYLKKTPKSEEIKDGDGE